ncbi:MAG: carboxypeptidase-like regulatory domain-containing protein [Thermonemataceae bacterium]|nr:carboxypeptidase-like regulatory domain-containing protein [Thermonemataceae bacterium]
MKKYLIIGFLFGVLQLSAQNITLSGLLLDKATKKPIEAARIIIPQAGRGVLSDEKGAFLLRVLPGDSLVVRSVNHRISFYVVPTNQEKSYSVTFLLEEAVEMIAPVQVYPYSDKDSFKEAFLSVETESPEEKAMKKNLEKGKMQDAAREIPQDSKSATQKQLENQAKQGVGNSLPTLNLFSPTAWKEFFRSIKETKHAKERKDK